ncbi:MAG: class I SAM-dependent RNA methyltransferase [Chloroflexi bacterium]|nr:class I SAM-dependent RNA methyltransferase [Chloroflexota bacterium]
MEKVFAVSAPGLEPFTAQELRELGLLASASASTAEVQSSPAGADDEGGGIEFEGDLSAIYRANLWLRTASRVLVRLGEFHAAAFSELRKKAGRLAWERYLAPGQPVALRVTCRKSRLYHENAVAERIAGAIGDRLNRPPPMAKFDEKAEEEPPQLIIVRIVNDHCTISVDSSGALLHRRGYRQAIAKAPLRETLAAGMIMASGWDRASPLIDPFCGSGTIPIEAALMVRGIAPGRARRFAFMHWPGFDPVLWKTLLAESERRLRAEIPKIAASDRDAGAIRMARANAERAGVAEAIEFSCRAVSAIEPTGTGWVVTNPPYGLRVSANKDLRNLYAQFGNVLRAGCPGWHIALLCSDLRLLGQMGMRLDSSLSVDNGGITVRLARGIVEG